MSGSLPIALDTTQPDILGGLLNWQKLAQEKAQTGLTQQQTVGAGLQNQAAALNLGLRNALYAPLLGGQAAPAQPAPPAGIPGGPQPSPGLAPLAGGPSGGATPTSAPGTPPGPGSPVLPAGHANVPPPVTPFGATMTMFGVPIPQYLAIGSAMSDNPTKGIVEAYNMGRQRITQVLTQAGNPQQVQQAATQLYQEGWLDANGYQRLYSDPSAKQAFLDATASPDSHMSQFTTLTGMGLGKDADGNVVINPTAITAKGMTAAVEANAKVPAAIATAGGSAAATAPYKQVKLPVQNPDGTWSEETVSGATAATRLNGGQPPNTGAAVLRGPGGTAPAANPPVGSPYAQALQAQENPGSNPAQANASGPGGAPTSSAVGNHQFLGGPGGTWQQMVQKYAPSWLNGRTPAQVDQLRTDPAYSAAMADAYGIDNAKTLATAGMPTTNAAVMLAHGFGAGGAMSLMRAPADATLAQVLPQAAQSNPTLANRTVSQLMQRSITNAQAGGLDPYAPFNLQSPGAPAQPGGVAGAPKLTRQQELATTESQRALTQDAKTVQEQADNVQNLQRGQAQLFQIRDLSGKVDAGSLADTRSAINNYFATFGPDWAQRAASAIPGLDPSKAGSQQEFVKQTLQQAGNAERDTLGARGGFRAIELYRKAFPNMEMQPGAIQDMSNLLIVAHQRDLDYANGQTGYFNQNRNAYASNPVAAPYQPLSNFDQQVWGINNPQSIHAPEVYVTAAKLLNGVPPADAFRGLTRDQQTEAVRIRFRADPNGQIAGGQPAAAPTQQAAQ